MQEGEEEAKDGVMRKRRQMEEGERERRTRKGARGRQQQVVCVHRISHVLSSAGAVQAKASTIPQQKNLTLFFSLRVSDCSVHPTIITGHAGNPHKRSFLGRSQRVYMPCRQFMHYCDHDSIHA